MGTLEGLGAYPVPKNKPSEIFDSYYPRACWTSFRPTDIQLFMITEDGQPSNPHYRVYQSPSVEITFLRGTWDP
jgi:hypothetical protein